MTCGEALALFDRELDGRLSSAERESLSGHVAGCASCRAEREVWTAASRALGASGPSPLPPGAAGRWFQAAIRSRPAPTLAAWFVAAARPVALAGAAAAVAVWLTAALTGSPSAPQPHDGAVQDPMELAMQLWTTEGTSDAP